MHDTNIIKPVLITGCGRSGTHFTVNLLQKANIDSSHEYEKPHHRPRVRVSWFHGDAEHSPNQQDVIRVIHQVRNPKKVISGFNNVRVMQWEVIDGTLNRKYGLSLEQPYIDDVNLVKNAITYVYYWNRMVEERACYRFRIENVREEWDTLVEMLGFEKREYPENGPHTTLGTTEHRQIEWDEILQYPIGEDVRNMAIEYGYED